MGPLAAPTIDDARARRVAEALQPAPVGSQRGALLRLFLAFLCASGLHELGSNGSLPARAVGAQGGGVPSIESGDQEMQRMRSLVAGAVGVGMMATGAAAQQAVQWRVEDGGNGHWYRGVSTAADMSWSDAQSACVSQGGHLATLITAAEDDFVWPLAQQPALWLVINGPGWSGAKGPWLGLRQSPGSATNDGWYWITGEPFTYAHPSFTPNDGCTSDEDALNYIGAAPSSRVWNDFPGDVPCAIWGFPRSYIIEWSADCNNDGIVDYGQILSGQLADINQNGVPDTCEVDPCPGDVTGNSIVDGIDLAALLAAWGGGKSQFDCDVDNDGIVGGSDLAVVLAGWGACP